MKQSPYIPVSYSQHGYEKRWMLLEAKRMGLGDRSKMLRFLIRFYIERRKK